MRTDTLIALVIVAVAAGTVVRRLVSQVRAAKKNAAAGPGCDNCGH